MKIPLCIGQGSFRLMMGRETLNRGREEAASSDTKGKAGGCSRLLALVM
jgi:hypothetical protein